MTNLAVNARDATPEGGRLRVALGRRDLGDGEVGKRHDPRLPAPEIREVLLHRKHTVYAPPLRPSASFD